MLAYDSMQLDYVRKFIWLTLYSKDKDFIESYN